MASLTAQSRLGILSPRSARETLTQSEGFEPPAMSRPRWGNGHSRRGTGMGSWTTIQNAKRKRLGSCAQGVVNAAGNSRNENRNDAPL